MKIITWILMLMGYISMHQIFAQSPSNIQEIHIGYDFQQHSWYGSTYDAYDRSANFVRLGGYGDSLNREGPSVRSHIPTIHLVVNSKVLPVFFGYGSFIEKDNVLDSILEASNILRLSLQKDSAAWALITNSGRNYLFQKKSTGWQLNPILIRDLEWVGWRLPLLVSFIFLLGALIAILGYLSHLRRIIETDLKQATEINALLTKPEKPLGLNGEDLLGFTALENAITRIIRNPELELPMSIVISGTWGSGKSSMMNRVKERLETDKDLSKRFMTTWFNAWHLQGESSLFNAFLLNIIDSYERQYSSSFSAFRFRLAGKRFMRLSIWKKFGFGFAIALLLPFLLLVIFHAFPLIDPRGWDWVNDYSQMLRNIFFNGNTVFSPGILTPIGAGLLILASLLFLKGQYIPTGLSAFFELLPKGNFKLEVEKAEVGSREKFRKEYWEIMDAGQKGRRLVVFIDDLDRIGGDKILELLEGINFISDIASRPPGVESNAPNTIFVLGMYTQEVARLVGAQLNKMNGSTASPEALGALYIEKMVQLIVPVPFDTDNKAQLKKLYEN